MKIRSGTFGAALLSIAVGIALSGCVAAIGNDTGPRPRTGSVTLGQELIDLQKARDAGAITESEYQLQRAKLLEHK